MDVMLNEFEKQYDNLKKSTDLKISTMTVVVELSIFIDIHKMGEVDVPEYFRMRECEIKIPKGGKTGDEFMNQFTLKYVEGKSRRNVKIFPNGRLHMTGVKSLKDVMKICDELQGYLGEFKVENLKICLINSNYHAGIGIEIRKLAKKLCECEDPLLYLPFSFQDPNKYPGLRFKYDNTTLLIFSSGAIMFAGGKSIESIAKCHRFIYDMIQNHFEEINCPKLLKVRK